MATKTEIANLAIAHLGMGKQIANIDTEQSNEANVMRLFFDTARDAVLEDFDWPFARRYIQLQLVDEAPNSEWGYSYRYPSTAMAIRKIFSGVRNDNRQSRVSYHIGSDNVGRLIFTDQRQAQAIYTRQITDIGVYSAAFIMALSFRLAYYIAPQLTSGDPFKMQDKVYQLYEIELSRARANAVNEEQIDEDPQSEFIRSRENVIWEKY